jgi:GNAT superfamily N-acetyltransferase
VFLVNPKGYAAFLARLDAPPRPNVRLRHSLQTPAPWEKSAAFLGPSHWRIITRLKRRARANQVSGASRTYVACQEKRVIGFYAVASGAIAVDSAQGRFRRNMPNSIPVVILARLAVDKDWQGKGIARALFRDAAQGVSHAADAIRAVLNN